MLTPLLAGWTLSGDDLPDRLQVQETVSPGFSLPGTEALRAFADLIGDMPDETPMEDAPSGVPFALPAPIPDDVLGEVMLSREIDFGSMSGDAARLRFDMLCGQGSITLQSLPPRFSRPGAPAAEPLVLTCDFHGAPVALDVSPMLLAGRRARLTLRFGPERPAGVCGPVLLHTSDCAGISQLTVTPDASAHSLLLTARITAAQAGDYLLHAYLCPAAAPASPQEAPPVREIRFHLAKDETKSIHLTTEAVLPVFESGNPYEAPSVKLRLYRSSASGRKALCDTAVCLCGFPGEAPAYTLPLCREDLLLPPESLLDTLTGLHVPGVLLSAAAPDMLYRLLTRAGISALHSAALAPEKKAELQRYPCAAFSRSLSPDFPDADPSVSAWQLCGLVTYPRPADPDMLPAELLRDAAGREVDLLCEDTQAVLAWLRAVSVRLRAEAMRQGRLRGALCAPGEYKQSDIAEAIRTALSPLHLSALPLSGAWWTGAHFSASLQAFIPRSVFSVDKSIRAVAVLEDGEGRVIARTEFPCAPWRACTGLISASLPDAPCILELVTRLYADEDVLEESTLPVYVGERGALEMAF